MILWSGLNVRNNVSLFTLFPVTDWWKLPSTDFWPSGLTQSYKNTYLQTFLAGRGAEMWRWKHHERAYKSQLSCLRLFFVCPQITSFWGAVLCPDMSVAVSPSHNCSVGLHWRSNALRTEWASPSKLGFSNVCFLSTDFFFLFFKLYIKKCICEVSSQWGHSASVASCIVADFHSRGQIGAFTTPDCLSEMSHVTSCDTPAAYLKKAEGQQGSNRPIFKCLCFGGLVSHSAARVMTFRDIFG